MRNNDLANFAFMPQSTSQENSAENPNSEDPHNTDVSGSGIVGESDGLGSEAVIRKQKLNKK